MTEYMQVLTRVDSTEERARGNIFRESARLFTATQARGPSRMFIHRPRFGGMLASAADRV